MFAIEFNTETVPPFVTHRAHLCCPRQERPCRVGECPERSWRRGSRSRYRTASGERPRSEACDRRNTGRNKSEARGKM